MVWNIPYEVVLMLLTPIFWILPPIIAFRTIYLLTSPYISHVLFRKLRSTTAHWPTIASFYWSNRSYFIEITLILFDIVLITSYSYSPTRSNGNQGLTASKSDINWRLIFSFEIREIFILINIFILIPKRRRLILEPWTIITIH